MKTKTEIKQEVLKEIKKSLDTWHSDKVRGHKVYFADAVEYGIKEAISLTQTKTIQQVEEVLGKLKVYSVKDKNGNVRDVILIDEFKTKLKNLRK